MESMSESQGEPNPSILLYKSSSIVRPLTHQIEEAEHQKSKRRIHLTPWDLSLLSIQYIQRGILLPKPPTPPLNLQQTRDQVVDHPLVSCLIKSLSQTLDCFFPLAGRLSAIPHDTSPPSTSIFIDCNNQGAEFIVAATKAVAASDILTPLHLAHVIQYFFPMSGAINIDGLSLPLLAVQVTQLSDDAVFIGCSVNHSVVDGTSFWHFLNTWSEISRTGLRQISSPPIIDRWFLDSCAPPIRLPFRVDTKESIQRYTPPSSSQFRECIFNFSAKSIKELKAKANSDMETSRISSLQALIAHLWRSVVRARRLEANQETVCILACGNRARLKPQLLTAYFGNASLGVHAKALAGDLLNEGLGWIAWQLNQKVASQTDATIRSWLDNWCKNPSVVNYAGYKPGNLVVGGSSRFDLYGNDFGWGKPVAIRLGGSRMIDGKVVVSPGPEEGSIVLEVCLSESVSSRLVCDMEFMEVVNC